MVDDMLGKPKYKVNDKVSFKFMGVFYTGVICVVDAYGTLCDDSDVAYDVKVEECHDYAPCLFKHLSESLLKLV